ncbi:MAG: methylmalonyl Co-A mutase-associated GTPase MeaB [Ignavibacterium sp.]|uniref:methylmalonyl Co-A mutase-associated GTPase MeaB n=1 Tax=Ignavibacterium sp. TaxID=2651167 RepID=UPI0040497D02
MKKQNTYKPDWTPENAGNEFATKIVKGIESKAEVKKQNEPKSKHLSVDDYVNGVLKFDRNILARAITLIESNNPSHYDTAQEVLKKLLPYSGNSIRIGITGVPGAGKSTLIETLGMFLIKQGHKVAVLTIDPSSTVTKGSILGDKTRMEKLSKENNCFIRPSPSGGELGGVTRKTRETISVVEAAGFDIVLIETVGVGQSEVTVRSMVDFFLLVLIAGAGDELQGIKRGVMELCDAIFINKADGDNEKRALIAQNDYNNALHYLQPATKGWQPKAYTGSALTGKGIEELWKLIQEFEKQTKANGIFEDRRKNQIVEWVFKMVENKLIDDFYNDDQVKKNLPLIKDKILNEELTPTLAAEKLLNIYKTKKGS